LRNDCQQTSETSFQEFLGWTPGADSQSNGLAVPQQRGGSGKLVARFRESETPTTVHAELRKQTQSCVLLRISNVRRVNALTSGSAAGGQRDQLNNGNG
jgi:hypothetical protein